MIGEVDDQLGRVWDALERSGAWRDTIVIVTADHGELLGDHGLIQKLGWFESSYHIVGIVRDPRHPEAHGSTVDRFTENVDLVPTICEAIGAPVPVACDCVPLTPFLRGEEPPWWRTAAHWEYDWRDVALAFGAVPEWPWDRRLERRNLAVTRTTRRPTCSSATARTWRSTWPPTPRGAPRSPIRRPCWRWPRSSSCGGRATSTAPSPVPS